MESKGRCYCGGIEIVVQRAKDGLVSYNHSKNHREWTGAAFLTTLLVPVAAVGFNDNKRLMKSYQRPGGYTRMFCSACGTPLCSKTTSGQTYEVSAYLLDGAPDPMYHINCSEAISAVLDNFTDSLQRFDKLPTGAGTTSAPPSPQRVPSPMESNNNTTNANTFGGKLSPITQPLTSSMTRRGSSSTATGVKLRLHSPHVIDENNAQMKEHGIISVPIDSIVELVEGDLVLGLGGSYGDYIKVRYNGKEGKISKKVATTLSTAPANQWSAPSATLDGLSNLSLGVAPPQAQFQSMPPSAQFQSTPPPAQFQSTSPPAQFQSSPPPAIGSAPVYNNSFEQPARAPPQRPSPSMAPQQPPAAMMPPTAMGSQQPMAPPPAMGSQQQQQPMAPPPATRSQQQPVASQQEFIPAPTFTGGKPGYVFKQGPQGVGYYLDPNASPTSSSGEPRGVSKPTSGPPGVSRPPSSNAPPGVATRRW